MSVIKDLTIATQLVHAGERRATPIGQPVATPLYATSTFTYDSMEEADKVLAGEASDYIYSRYGNPTVAALEDALATIENGKVACAYSSGMAAIHAALLACDLAPGAIILASQDLYGSSLDLLYRIFLPFGIKTVMADFTDLKALREKVLEIKPRVLLAETISNPLLKICDIEACAAIAHEAAARLIIDNTFASPFLCQPLNVGADFVVHSATKYLGGHADAMGGVVIAREEFDRAALIGIMKLVGGILSVWEAHQILRGIKTLGLRLERQCTNARLLAQHFSYHNQIEKVYYPGLPENANLTHRVLRSPFAGALVSVKLKNDSRDAAFRFMDSLKLCVRATSLGDVFTGVAHPATASHRELSQKKRAGLGITDGLVRFSVGIEEITDIIADIEMALKTSDV
jgi:cystathionine gamma-synthase/methionine-gamma-lyase